jgi:hypothetical protein
MCQRRDAIVFERKEALEEEARQERMRLRAIERKKQERIQLIQNCIAAVLGTAVSVAIMYGIWMMFHWRD